MNLNFDFILEIRSVLIWSYVDRLRTRNQWDSMIIMMDGWQSTNQCQYRSKLLKYSLNF